MEPDEVISLYLSELKRVNGPKYEGCQMTYNHGWYSFVSPGYLVDKLRQRHVIARIDVLKGRPSFDDSLPDSNCIWQWQRDFMAEVQVMSNRQLFDSIIDGDYSESYDELGRNGWKYDHLVSQLKSRLATWLDS